MSVFMGSFVCFESVTFLGQTGLELVTLLHPLPRCWEFPEIDKILGWGDTLQRVCSKFSQ